MGRKRGRGSRINVFHEAEEGIEIPAYAKASAGRRGTGLGLFIARKIVEAHGGVIAAESEGEDKGSTFTIRLRKL